MDLEGRSMREFVAQDLVLAFRPAEKLRAKL
jgi:hypothetical protein